MNSQGSEIGLYSEQKVLAIKSTIFKTTDYKRLTSSPGTSSGPCYYSHCYFPIFTTLIHSSEPETARATSMSSTDEHILSFESLQSVQFAWNVSPIEDLALLSIQDHIPRSLCNILPRSEGVHCQPIEQPTNLLGFVGHIARLWGSGNDLHVMPTHSP